MVAAKCFCSFKEYNVIEQAGDVIMSDAVQAEAIQLEAKFIESGAYEKHDPAPLITQQGNKDAVALTTSVNDHYLTPARTRHTLDAAHMPIVQERPDATVIIPVQECDRGSTAESDLEVSGELFLLS